MDIQRIRNLTTGLLHTEIVHVYEDLEAITGQEGLMTHMLPRVMRAVEPWLRKVIDDERLWNGEFDQSHIGEFTLPDPTIEDREAMFERYKSQPNPLENKEIIFVTKKHD